MSHEDIPINKIIQHYVRIDVIQWTMLNYRACHMHAAVHSANALLSTASNNYIFVV